MKVFSGRRIWMALLAMAALLALLAAACGDDGGDDPTTAPAPTATSAATQQQPATGAQPTAAAQQQPTAAAQPTTPPQQPATPDAPKLRVVTTTNFAADWARIVGGDRVEVSSLLPIGSDPHSWQPGAGDVAKLADADLVLSIGLGLEAGWLEELIHNASAEETTLIELANEIDPIEFAVTGHDDHEEEEEGGALTGRLLIADRDQPTLSVLDLTTELLSENSVQVAAPGATLYTSPSGRFAFALARGPEDNDDRVHIIDGGVYLEPHEGHMDLVTGPVSLLSLGTSDERPVHTSVHSGWTAIYHDGSGRAALFEEHDLEEERDDYEPIWLDAGLQHGAVVPLGEDYFVVTSNNPDYPATAESSLPLGAEVWTLDGQVVYDASNRSCPGMHGEAANSHGVLMGCVGGVLFIEGHDGEYEHDFIDNPADMHESSRIGSIWGHDDSEIFFGSASYREDGERYSDGLWMIDPEGGSITRVPLPDDNNQVYGTAFDAHGEEFFALTADGMLNVIEVETGEVEETVQLMAPFDGDTSPYFIVIGEVLYLSDRAGGRIAEFHIHEGEIEHEWPIGGNPGRLAFVGVGVGESEDEHGHADHGHGPLDPHFWFDPMRVKTAVMHIAEELSHLDPASESTFHANADAYGEQLDELHAWTQQQLSDIPEERRVLVTSHDSLSYFAVAYGFEIVGTVIPSGTTEVEPSARDIAELIEVIEEHGVPAVFGESTVSERLARSVSEETGVTFAALYSGSLGEPGSGDDTYLGMFRHNVETIANALK